MAKTKITLQVKIYYERVYLFEISDYFKKNLGSPFVIMFMIFILAAAGCLSLGLENVANEFAIYAYFLLVIGVLLQAVSYIRYRK